MEKSRWSQIFLFFTFFAILKKNKKKKKVSEAEKQSKNMVEYKVRNQSLDKVLVQFGVIFNKLGLGTRPIEAQFVENSKYTWTNLTKPNDAFLFEKLNFDKLGV